MPPARSPSSAAEDTDGQPKAKAARASSPELDPEEIDKLSRRLTVGQLGDILVETAESTPAAIRTIGIYLKSRHKDSKLFTTELQEIKRLLRSTKPKPDPKVILEKVVSLSDDIQGSIESRSGSITDHFASWRRGFEVLIKIGFAVVQKTDSATFTKFTKIGFWSGYAKEMKERIENFSSALDTDLKKFQRLTGEVARLDRHVKPRDGKVKDVEEVLGDMIKAVDDICWDTDEAEEREETGNELIRGRPDWSCMLRSTGGVEKTNWLADFVQRRYIAGN